jgi:PadR family transcriptional regulator, regulatory protein PadR
MTAPDLRRGSAEMILLSLLEARSRHGYELAKLVESQSDMLVRYQVASMYPILYRMERKGLVRGTWIEKPNERRRRFYRLTPLGKRALAEQRRSWREFVRALHLLTGFNHA